MTRSATDVMRDAIAAAVLDAVMAFKDGSGGIPNALARDIGAVHANTAFADLPAAVQKAVEESVRSAFARLKKEGYTVAESASVRPSAPRGGFEQRPPPSGPRGADRPRGPRPPAPRGRPAR